MRRDCECYREFAFPDVRDVRLSVSVDGISGMRDLISRALAGVDIGPNIDYMEVVGGKGRVPNVGITGLCMATNGKLFAVSEECASKFCERGGEKCPRKAEE